MESCRVKGVGEVESLLTGTGRIDSDERSNAIVGREMLEHASVFEGK